MPDKQPGYDTLQKMLLTAEEKVLLAEARADKAEGIIAQFRRHLWGAVLLIFDADDMMENLIKRKERTVKEKENRV